MRMKDKQAAAKEKVPGTAAFSKFVKVLQTIADAPGDLGMADLCRTVGLPRATVYRIVDALRAEGFVHEVEPARKLVLGARLINMASRSWASFDLRTHARAELEKLRDLTGETVHLAVPSGTEMVYIDKLQSPQTVRMTSRIGTRISLFGSSVGKAYLSALPRTEREPLLNSIVFKRMTPFTIMTRSALETELRKTEKRGYAIDREETELEIRCIGAAILNSTGRPIGAISVSVPKYRYDRRAETHYPRLLVECTRQIGSTIGGAPAESSD